MIKIRWTIILPLLIVNIAAGQASVAKADYETYLPHQLHEDLNFLLNKFESIHPDYYNETPKDTVVKRYNELKSKITKPLTRVDFMNLFAPVVYSVIKDGHNYLMAPEEDLKLYTDKGGKLFPYPVTIRERRLFVNSSLLQIPYNSEITRINQVPAKDVIEKLLSGYNAESDHFEEVINSDWFSNSYWFNYGGCDSYEMEYRSSLDSSVGMIASEGNTGAEIDSLRRRQKNENFLFYELPEVNAGVLEYNACTDLKNFRPFCDSVFNIMQTEAYDNLIIDIRINLGGTTRTNEALFEYITDVPLNQFEYIETRISKEQKKYFREINRFYQGWFKWYHYIYYPIYIRSHPYRKQMLVPEYGEIVKEIFTPEKPPENPLRFKGSVYLLTSHRTYSAVACLAAALKCYNIGTIVGQETGEPTSFYADWKPVTLPNTQIECVISSKKLVLACDKNDGHGVIPDYIVDDEIVANEQHDLEMELVKKLIRGEEVQ